MNLVVGALAIVLSGIISLAVQALAEVLASRRGIRPSKAIAVPAQVALTAGYASLAAYGGGWWGVLGVLGILWQCLFVVAAAFSQSALVVKNPATATVSLASVVKMSEQGRAGEALALLDQFEVAPEDEREYLLARTVCAYRAGAFEESIELDQRLAEAGIEQPEIRHVAAADARLSAALRDSRAVTRGELAECAAAILNPALPNGYAKFRAYEHSKALLTLASGDPESAMHAGVAVVADRWMAPADRALVTAMIAIAAARAKHPDLARFWALKVPDWCPLRPAVERELGIHPLDSVDAPGDEDADCFIVD